MIASEGLETLSFTQLVSVTPRDQMAGEFIMALSNRAFTAQSFCTPVLYRTVQRE